MKKREKMIHGDGIAIRHLPDGQLLAFFDGKTFSQKDIAEAINKILNGSHNFKIEHVHTLETHVNYDNKIVLNYKKGKKRT